MLAIPTVLLTLWVAKLSARYALLPFTQLSSVFASGKKQTLVESIQLEAIKEQDVKQIAMKLQQALKQKADVLEQQVMFNQGMAHELRTPLQVMQNSVELLSTGQAEMASLPAFKRLEKAMIRMGRLSDGLLWLTSNQVFDGQTQVAETIVKTLDQLEEQCAAHGVIVQLNINTYRKVAIPEAVLALIITNLFNNVIQHGQPENEKLVWHIVANDEQLKFSNLANQASSPNLQAQHFGIGLTLVSHLAKRFNLVFGHQTVHEEFVVTLSLD